MPRRTYKTEEVRVRVTPETKQLYNYLSGLVRKLYPGRIKTEEDALRIILEKAREKLEEEEEKEGGVLVG